MNNPTTLFNKYLPIAVLYFFLNGFLLPLGLLYTTLLTPIFLAWLAKYAIFRQVSVFFLVTLPFAAIHLYNGVHLGFYIKSYLLLFTVFVFCLSFYQFLKVSNSLNSIFKSLLILNGVMVIISLVLLFVPALELHFWNDNTMSMGNINIRRLKMLTYEPSYYSTLFAPIAIYYLIRIARQEVPQKFLYLGLVLVPLILSLSFGVILGIVLAFVLLILLNVRTLVFNSRILPYVIVVGTTFSFLILIALFTFPDNVFFVRIQNTLSGKDLSFNGRTLDSFIIALDVANQKSLLWGVGPGQVKLLGLEVFKDYYNYDLYTVEDIGIPNNLGDFLATFGILGMSLKLIAEIYLYFKTKVYSNYYRQALFLFIFIYQFTGSYIMNIAEYVIWILAFKQGLFPSLNKREVQITTLQRHKLNS